MDGMRLEWNPPNISSFERDVEWNTPYASIVYSDRPWVDVAINQISPELLFAGVFNGDYPQAFEQFTDKVTEQFSEVIDDYDWGKEGETMKRYRTGVPTYKFITDSGELRDSMQVGEIREIPNT